ncbi:MAG TPA: choice-of-anchor D domain-containing protein [Steroidobacteraceae bacterium]|nr:choice-of-anchor D domain-containing protein [Steroidobacteraceae bacterium]
MFIKRAHIDIARPTGSVSAGRRALRAALLASPLIVLTLARPAEAQTATSAVTSIAFAAAAIDTTAPQTLTASFSVSGYTGSFTPTATMHYGHDYQVGTATCTSTGASSETCNFPITFAPTLPGVRKDAIFVYNGSTRLASVLVYGIGQGPLAALNPGVVTAVTAPNYVYNSAVDENGTDYYLSETGASITSYTTAGVSTILPVSGLVSPRSIAIDGAGVLYTHNDTFDTSIITYDTVTGVTGSFTMPVNGFWDIQTVDPAGNVISVDLSGEMLYQVSPSGSYATYQLNPTVAGCCEIALDSSNNVFISGQTIAEVTPADVQTQVNANGADEGMAVDAAGIIYATRYGLGSFDYGVAELQPSNYGTAVLGLLPGQAPLGVGLGSDGTLFVGNYTTLDIVQRSQGVIAFGEQTAGTASAAQAVQILNVGNEALTVSSVALAGTGYARQTTGSLDCTNGMALQPAAYCQVSLVLTPPTAGTFDGTLTFTSNSLYQTTTQVVDLSGFVYGINVVASPTTLAFGTQQTGSTSAASSVTLTNQGLQYYAGIGFPTSSNPVFTPGYGTCTSSLMPGASCQLSVTFTPTAATAYSGTITLSANSSGGGPAQTVTFSVTGTGTAPAAPVAVLSPTTATFAGTLVGSASAAQTFTLSNTGNATLTTSGATFTGANPGDFSVSGTTCGATVAAGASCSFAVIFNPAAAGSRAAVLNVADNAAGSPQTATLSGTGVAVRPQAVLMPTSVAFPATTTGMMAAAQQVKLSNPGNGPLAISAISITGADPGDFAQTNNCGASLAANASCMITVTFSPQSAAALTASLSVADNAAASPQTAALSGMGVAPAVPQAKLSPTSLSFAGTTVGATSASQTVTLSNPGTATLAISSIMLAGANPGDFTQSSECGTTLAAAASCTISVSFAPTAAGSTSATLEVADNATGTPQMVSLSGLGNAAPTPNFNVTSPTAPQSAAPGGTASYSIVVTPENGTFANAVSFSASGLPAGATVTFNPATLTPGSASATTEMTIQLAAATAGLTRPERGPAAPGYALALLVPVYLQASGGRRRPRQRRGRFLALLGFCVLGVAVAAISGCDGGYRLPGLSNSTYTVTVTATSGTEVHTTTVSLTVQQ